MYDWDAFNVGLSIILGTQKILLLFICFAAFVLSTQSKTNSVSYWRLFVSLDFRSLRGLNNGSFY